MVRTMGFSFLCPWNREIVFSREKTQDEHLMNERSLIHQSILEDAGRSGTRRAVCRALSWPSIL